MAFHRRSLKHLAGGDGIGQGHDIGILPNYICRDDTAIVGHDGDGSGLGGIRISLLDGAG